MQNDLSTSGLELSSLPPARFHRDEQRLDTLFLSTWSRQPELAGTRVMLKQCPRRSQTMTGKRRSRWIGGGLLNSAELRLTNFNGLGVRNSVPQRIRIMAEY